jgi:hypothetical protein
MQLKAGLGRVAGDYWQQYALKPHSRQRIALSLRSLESLFCGNKGLLPVAAATLSL